MMDAIFLYLFISIILICLILMGYALTYNKFQEYIIRINEVESLLDSNLRNKYDLINRTIAIIKGNVDIKREIFEEIIKLRSRKISNFELDRNLADATNEFYSLREEFPEINKSEEIRKIAKSITEIDEKLVSLKAYYNDTITKYNRLTRSFPSNFIGLISGYKEKLFFDRKNMNDEIFDDFKL